MIKPQRLKKGDKVAIVSLSAGTLGEKWAIHRYYIAKERLENDFGLKVVVMENTLKGIKYLDEHPEARAKDLMDAFKDDSIKAVFNAIGGDDTIRLLPYIDFEVIRNHPKIFTGFSDVTALLLMIYKKTGMVTYHGLMATPDFGFDCEIDEFSFQNFQAAINGEELNLEGNKIYRDGAAEGIIWGGNLATLVSLCGIDFIPNEDFIFFAEDLNEPVYKIDKMFTQLFNIKEFKKYCKGIVLGDFLDCGNEKWLEEFFVELSGIHQIPIVGGFKITHNRKKITIPIGKKAILSGANLKIKK